MNKTFKMIWSKVKAAWVIVSEIVSSNGGATAVTISHTKPKAGRWIISAALQATLVAGLLTLFAPFAAALPANPQVIHGTANIQTSGTMMNITNSPNAIINWGSFSIAANETARFIQQSANSTVLNRVTGGDPSRIFGALQSNGRVFLINQNGILIGANARIDVAGLVASTLNLSNQDFLAGKMQFGDGTPGGKLENQGMITTPEGGQVYLIAPDVTNKGTITAPNGDLLLAAGKEVLLVEKTTPEIAYVVSAPEDQAINLGTIAADVGRVGMYGSVVRNSGKISADSATSTGGKIYLRATKKIELAETSSISANGVKGGEIIAMTAQNGVVTGELTARGSITAKGDGSKNSGGFVETSAGKLDLHGVQINTNGGTWLIDPVDFVIGDESNGDIAASAVGTALETNDVTIQTTNNEVECTNGLNCGNGTEGSGDITVNADISWSSDKTLTLEAGNDIKINAAITGEHENSKLELKAENGFVTQETDGVITVGTLEATAKTGITLEAANKVSKFQATNATSDAISFVNTTPLEITGAVNTAPASDASIAINNTGDITITGEINAYDGIGSADEHKVQITSTEGSITQEAGGKVIANWLSVAAANGIELDKNDNEVWYFNAANSTSGDIKFKNSWNPQDNFGFNINKVVNEGSGNIEITSTDIGVTLGYDSEITSSGGAITLDGTNTKAFTGVMLETGSTITSNGGDINITGKGGNGTENGVGGFNGVNISGVIDSGAGNVDIIGTGGKGFDDNGTGGSWGGTGVALNYVTYINNAPLTITGIKGEDGDGYTGNGPVYGVELAGTMLNTQTEALDISGGVYIDSDSRIGLDQDNIPQTGNINFTGNLLNVGSLGVAAGSTIEVAGDYAQEYSGNLYIAVADEDTYSKLAVTGKALLGGGLNVSIDDSYEPQLGDYFPFLTANGGIEGNLEPVVSSGNIGDSYGFEVVSDEKFGYFYVGSEPPDNPVRPDTGQGGTPHPDPDPEPEPPREPDPPPPPPPPPPPTIEECTANPGLSGCGSVLPSLDTCTTNPTAPGCLAVLPSMDACTTNPTAPGCSAVLPSMDVCTTNPTAPGCSAVLPSMDACTTNPTAPGCSAVLPSMDTCTTNPTAPGCSVVLPSMDVCTTNPTAPGCSAVLPSMDVCTTNPTAPGCSVVLPSMDACTTNPTAPGCSAVLPSMDTCTTNPTAPGCSVVLPSMDACTTNPTAPGCSAVLPSMDACTTNPTAPGCSAVLPSMDACTTNPTAPGCSAVLPSMDACTTNPTAPGCSVVLPPLDACLSDPSAPGCSVILPEPVQTMQAETSNVTSQISKETQEQPTSAVAPAGLKLVGMVADDSGEAAGSGGNVSNSTGDAAATSAGDTIAAGDDEDQEKQEAREEQQSTQEQQAEKPAKNYCN